MVWFVPTWRSIGVFTSAFLVWHYPRGRVYLPACCFSPSASSNGSYPFALLVLMLWRSQYVLRRRRTASCWRSVSWPTCLFPLRSSGVHLRVPVDAVRKASSAIGLKRFWRCIATAHMDASSITATRRVSMCATVKRPKHAHRDDENQAVVDR